MSKSKEKKYAFFLKVKGAMLAMQKMFADGEKVDVIKCLESNGLRRNGGKMFHDIDWANTNLTDEYINEYANKLSESYVRAVKRNIEANAVDDELSKFTPREIFAYLRKIGYSGTLVLRKEIRI